jgi:hypothetical protein
MFNLFGLSPLVFTALIVGHKVRFSPETHGFVFDVPVEIAQERRGQDAKFVVTREELHIAAAAGIRGLRGLVVFR